MADLKISELTNGTAVASGDIVPAVRAGANVRVPLGTAAGKGANTLTAGRIVVTASGEIFDVDANLQWDATNNRLTIIGTGSSYDGAVNGPLQLQVDGNGNGFVVALSATEYTRIVSGGAMKGFIGAGNVPFGIQNAGPVEIRPGSALQFQFTTASGMVPSANDSWDIGTAATRVRRLFLSSWLRMGSFTVATLGSASTAGAGAMVYCSDETGGGVPVFSDGTNWRRVTDRAIAA